jgi:S-adenosylmethionine hydrolase
MSRSLITLTTDFGTGSPYVAQMKGVILGINPEANIVDITHDIPPQDIAAGALVLREVFAAFEPGTIHVAVVDPGVGTDRRLIHADIQGRHYLAPDNGLLTLLEKKGMRRVVQLNERRYWRSQVSATFHGRDILAPVAAHLSLGVDPLMLGPPARDLVRFEQHIATSPGQVRGEILAIDHFGNLITNINHSVLALAKIDPADPATCIQVKSVEVSGISKTYGEHPPETVIALFGSGGFLEIAVVNGHAAQHLHACRGDVVEVFGGK